MPAPAAQPHMFLVTEPAGHAPAIRQPPAMFTMLLVEESTRAVARPPVPYSRIWSPSTTPARRRDVLNHDMCWLAVELKGTPPSVPVKVCDPLMSAKEKSESVPSTMLPNCQFEP